MSIPLFVLLLEKHSMIVMSLAFAEQPCQRLSIKKHRRSPTQFQFAFENVYDGLLQNFYVFFMYFQPQCTICLWHLRGKLPRNLLLLCYKGTGEKV